MTAGDARLDAIQARLDAATPGPWANYGDLGHEVYAVNAHEDAEPGYVAESIPSKCDAEFIAHALADVAYLLAELRKAHEALTRVEDECRYLDTLAPGDQHYAKLIRAAVAAANGNGK